MASCYRSLNLSWDFQSSRGPNLVRVTTPFGDKIHGKTESPLTLAETDALKACATFDPLSSKCGTAIISNGHHRRL